MKIGKRLTTIGKNAASAANYIATSPLTQSSQAKTSRNVWSDTKNAVLSLFGKGAPLHDRAAEIKNLVWDRERGNLVNGSYEKTGHLVLTLRDGVLSERALQMLSALDDSETGELDPSSKGLQGGFFNIGNVFAHRRAKKECDNLLELRKSLEKNGGSLKVEQTADGFGRMLQIRINTRNKSTDEVAKEIMGIFGALGIGSPDLAESLAKELIHERDMNDMNYSREMSHRRAVSPETQKEQPVNEDVVQGSAAPEQDCANDTDPKMFSLSGDYALHRTASSVSGADHQAAQQAQFLESEEGRIASRENSSVPQQLRGESPSISNAEEFLNAAEGLGGVTFAEHSSSVSASTDAPLVTPAAQQATPRSSGSQTRGGVR
ncbi:MAG: hypothetical protein AB8U44_01685 [Aaplasma endosymbiont of Hyalomma asiaticum]